MLKLSKSARRTLKAIHGSGLTDEQLWTAHRAFVAERLEEMIEDRSVVRVAADEYALKPELVH